jgi:serine/threonine protein kinase
VADRTPAGRRLDRGRAAGQRRLTVGTGPDARRGLKVAINDAASARLAAEDEVLGRITHPRVVRLVDGPVQVGNRRALVLESAGEQTLGDVLSARTRLSLDLLERWGTDLLEALVVLDRVGVDHRDIKPANLGVRQGRGSRGDRSKHLVLFDFSLARAGAMALTAGTPPYLDPFLESSGRGRYDSAAERYAATVVLFEMATGRTPVYGDGLSDPAAVPDEAMVAAKQFDPSVAAALVEFFHTALARDAARPVPEGHPLRGCCSRLVTAGLPGLSRLVPAAQRERPNVGDLPLQVQHGGGQPGLGALPGLGEAGVEQVVSGGRRTASRVRSPRRTGRRRSRARRPARSARSWSAPGCPCAGPAGVRRRG